MVRVANDGGMDVATAVMSGNSTNASSDASTDLPIDILIAGGGTNGSTAGSGNSAGTRDTEGSSDNNGGGSSANGGSSPNGSSANIRKIWNTMGDDRVRDTHAVLNGTSKALNEAFFTIDGDSAMSPARFTLPENNIGCRCWLTFKKI